MKQVHLNNDKDGKRTVRSLLGPAISTVGFTVCLLLPASVATAQTSAIVDNPAQPKPTEVYETLYLTNLTAMNDLNDIQTAMRNVLPRAKIYGMPSERAISLWATPEELALAHRILADLDRKRNIYRITYMLKDVDAGKSAAAQHFTLIVISGEKTELKQGSRVPIVTGSFDADSGRQNTQVQYIDIGLRIEVTADGFQDGVHLKTKVEQSSISDEKPAAGTPNDPVVLQTVLEGSSTAPLGKSLVVGSLDAPGSTRHEEVEVVAELVK